MKSIFEEHASREELLRAAEQAITETTGADGGATYRIADPERDAWKSRLETESRNAARELKLRQDAEAKLARYEAERETQHAELERLRAAAPADLRETLKRYAEQSASSKAKIEALEAELAPLREENAAYRERETRAKIEAQLVDAARKLNCRESALRDVKRLAPMFKLDAAGFASTEDAKTAEEVLREEIALSPHWLDRSQGGAADAGLDAQVATSRERFAQALRGNDFAEALRHAPRTRVDR